jgi:hypothetical protein
MFTTWEEACFRVFQRNFTTVPKCLWYYKLKYKQRGESQKWEDFFHDTPFQSWGKLKKTTKELRVRKEKMWQVYQPRTPLTNLTQDMNRENYITPLPNPKNPPAPSKTTPRTSDGTGDYPPPASPTARVNECPTTKKKKFCLYYQNVRGLRDDEKLEFITRLREEKAIDAFIITETHLEGDFQSILR